MAKVEKVVAPVAPAAPKAAAPVKNVLLERIEEVEGDLHRLAQLLAEQFGGDFAKQALEIVSKKQGK